ncbi:MAG: hypothetical protein WCE91_08480 [Nitrososphaeraceae archaeon]|jgi:hypothetical protein
MKKMSQNAISPELVAGVILKVVKSDGPDFRNIVGISNIHMKKHFGI